MLFIVIGIALPYKVLLSLILHLRFSVVSVHAYGLGFQVLFVCLFYGLHVSSHGFVGFRFLP